MILLQPEPQFAGIFVVALLAHRLQVHLVELGLHRHLLIARRTGEVIHAPGLVQGGEDVPLNDLIADVTEIAEELMIVHFAVSQSFSLVVSVAQEGLFAFGAHEVLHVPVLAQSRDDPLLDGSAASPANGDAHFVVATQTVQLVLKLLLQRWVQ